MNGIDAVLFQPVGVLVDERGDVCGCRACVAGSTLGVRRSGDIAPAAHADCAVAEASLSPIA
jgi:hypothetical protein